MEFIRPETIGLEASEPQIDTLPPRCTTYCALDIVSSRTREFEITRECAEITRKGPAYRHQLCEVHHFTKPASVVVRRSSVHGYGLFANSFISKDELIAEYTGVLITSVLLADLAERVLREHGFDSTYLFEVGSTSKVIDATFSGSVARFANHSCDPNAVSFRRNGRVFLLAKRDIQIGEEICYDYNLRYQEGLPRIKCMCGSTKCREFMDFKPGET